MVSADPVRYFYRHQLYSFSALGLFILFCAVVDFLEPAKQPERRFPGRIAYVLHFYANWF